MILIDPELDFSRAADALNAVSAKPSAGSAAKLSMRPFRLPSTRTLTRTLAQFLTLAQAAVRLRGQVTVLLTSDAAVRDLNRRFRGKDQPTDVLSFPASNPDQNQKGKRKNGPDEIAGDVAISVETALGQSVEQGHSLAIEIKVLMLHGLLHLAGHDHETDAGAMQRRERSLRARLGLPLGLIERSASPSLSRRGGRKALGRKATAGPSTSAAKTASAQDDKAKRTSKPKKRRRVTVRAPRIARVPRSRSDAMRRRKP